jgi:hypothetical protein
MSENFEKKETRVGISEYATEPIYDQDYNDLASIELPNLVYHEPESLNIIENKSGEDERILYLVEESGKKGKKIYSGKLKPIIQTSIGPLYYKPLDSTYYRYGEALTLPESEDVFNTAWYRKYSTSQNGELTFNLYIPEELKRLAEELKSHRSGSEVRTRSKFKTQDTLDGAEENAGIKLATIMDHYPVETYEQVEMAKQYFSRYLTEFEPQERHKFASELKERMSLLKIASTKDLDSYAGTDYGDVDTHLIKRKDYLPEEEKNTIDLFIEKRAYVSPECFAEALLDFDQFTGLNKYRDRGIKDPYYTTFAKTAEKKEWRYKTDTGAYISEGSLERLAQETQILRNGFSKHFADLFMARPKETFEKAPENVKKVLVRLAEQYYAL